jgi:hypothetical protein
MNSRRSFLAAIMGAIAAPAVAKAVPEAPAGMGDFLQPGDIVPFYIHRGLSPVPAAPWVISDRMEFVPGIVANEALFPPPFPEDFLIKSIGFRFRLGASDEDIEAVLKSCEFDFRELTVRSNGPLQIKQPVRAEIWLSGLVAL